MSSFRSAAAFGQARGCHPRASPVHRALSAFTLPVDPASGAMGGSAFGGRRSVAAHGNEKRKRLSGDDLVADADLGMRPCWVSSASTWSRARRAFGLTGAARRERNAALPSDL